MPLTSKGQKILSEMVKEYGEKKGKEVFYASINAGKITGAEEEGESEKIEKAIASGARALIFKG